MDPLHHHHHHHHAPLHWGYSTSGGSPATGHPQHNTWVPPPTTTQQQHQQQQHNNHSTITAAGTTSLSTRKLKRAISESDCEDLYSEESSKEQTSPGESDSCHMMSRKRRRGVIEKKRRDRINLSLCELKRLVPSAYEKQGSAKLEKAEILQLTVDHLKNMHSKGSDGMPFDAQRFAIDYHIVGFRECASEVARYLVTMEGMDIQDPLRLRLMSHLQCFVAQREIQLKSSGAGDLLSPTLSSSTASSAAAAAAVVNPISPNMGHATNTSHTNWATPTSYQQGYHHHQMMPTTYQQNAYASQSAAAQSGGYVPNLPPSLSHHQYDQYTTRESSYETPTTGNAASSQGTTAGGRTGVTTRSQANNNNQNRSGTNNNTENGNNSNNNGGTNSSSASSGNDVNGGAVGVEQNGPTYTDLSAVSSSASSAIAAVSSPSSVSATGGLVAASAAVGNNRLQNNYNIYGHIHYPADTFGGQYHLSATGYNLHFSGSSGSVNGGGGIGGGLQSDPSRGYNVVGGGQSNGNAKPYRPWGAEMAY